MMLCDFYIRLYLSMVQFKLVIDYNTILVKMYVALNKYD